MNHHKQRPPLSWGLISVFITVSAILLFLGILFINYQKKSLLKEKESELAAVANLKAGQINQWRSERIGDADLIQNSLSIVDEIYNFLNAKDSLYSKNELLIWMESLVKNYDYLSAHIIDPQGKVRLSVPESESGIGPLLRPQIQRALKRKRFVFTDLHRTTATSIIHIDVVIPMVRVNIKDSLLVGLVSLRIDPGKILYPLVRSWPTLSKTSETLLLRQEGDSVLYLNDLKHIPGSGFALKRSVRNTELVGAKAVLGYEGITDGVDYRNVEVIACIKKVPDSEWYMVSKVDKEELINSFSIQLLLGKLMIVFFIAAFGAIIGWVIWHGRVRFYKQKYDTELDRMAVRKHFEYILKYANDIIILYDKDLLIVEVNDRVCEVYNYTRKELIGMHARTLRDDKEAPFLEERINILNEAGYSRYETIHKTKDGSTFPIEISARLVEFEGTKYYQVIGRDVSERRKIEDSLKTVLERYNLATEAAKLAVWDWDVISDHLIWDDNVYKLYAVEKDQMPPVYDSWLKLLYPEDLERSKSEIEKALQGEKEYNTEFRIIMPDCSLRHIKAFGHVVRNQNGKAIRMIGINYDITEQKKSENLLREREFWLSESQRVGKIGSYILDIKSNIWTSSEVLDEIFGIPADATKTLESWNMLIHPQQREEMLKYFLEEVIGEKKPFDKEYRILKNNSVEECWVWGRGELSYDQYGKPDKMFGTIQDITERKTSHLLLHETEQTYSGLINSITEAIYIHDEEGVFIEVNEGACQMYGYSKQELLGKTPEFVSAPGRNDLNEVIAIIKKVFLTGKKEQFEFWGKRKNGDVFLKDIVSNKGIYFGQDVIISIARDITDRRKIQEELSESREKLLSIFRVAPTGIGVVKDRVLWDVNPMICEMTGYEPSELNGKSAMILYPTEDEFNYVGKEKYEQISKFGTGMVETKWKRKDGTLIDVLLCSTPMHVGDLSYGVTFTALDITHRKRTEREIVVAKEKAEESDRLKTAFLHNISHEIRTPMNAIVGFTALLDDSDLQTDTRKQYIDIIFQSSNQLLSIITDIVDISNIETGQTKVSIGRVNINLVIRNLFDQFKFRAEQQGLAFSYHLSLEDNEAIFETDNTKLIQILSNLLNNSLKFTKIGKIEFGYHLKNGSVEFHVSDTGIGIPEDKLSKIFERFYQVEHSISRQFGGTGLGLSICQAYANLLNGIITVESKQGTGSTFYLTLPFSGVPGALNNVNNQDYKDHKPNIPFMGKTILVAEDDDINYLVVKKSLEPHGFRLIRAENGKETVDICKNNQNIDLVLLDLKMPVMDGLEAMNLIKQFRPEMIFVALSAYAFDSDRKNALELGCSDYISKPFTKKELLEIIGKYL